MGPYGASSGAPGAPLGALKGPFRAPFFPPRLGHPPLPSTRHLLSQCPAGRGLRDALCERWPLGSDAVAAWVLRDADALDVLAAKVRYLGLLTAALVHACGCAGRAA